MTSRSAANVLIIEDEQAIANDLVDVTKELGCHVIGVATTHAEATTLARQTFPDLILSDIKLADGSSGLDAVLEIHRVGEVPVICVTGSPERLRGRTDLSTFS